MKCRAFFNGRDEDQSLTADSVVEEERERVDTGILDAHGNPIYREPKRLQVGFLSNAP
ncbi:MAG: hypothetical protein V4510_13385 [bacterium]